MAQILTIIRGDTIDEVVQLRIINKATDVPNSFVIEAGSDIDLRFPGEVSTVVLSTSNVGEISIIDANIASISFNMSPVKSALLKTGKSQSIDVIVTQGISGKIQTATMSKILTVVDRANI